MNPTVDAEILGRAVTAFEKIIEKEIDPAFDNNIARRILEQRKIPDEMSFDNIQTTDRVGKGAVIAPKGASPRASGSSITDQTLELYQIIDGFNLHAKDIAGDPKLRARNIRIALTNIARKEDDFVILGSSDLGVTGLVGTAQANPNGKIVAAGAVAPDVNNIGAWDGSDANIDIHADVLEAIQRISARFKPRWLVGNRTDILELFRLDSERQPFYKTLAPLFGRSPLDNPLGTWLLENDQFTAGKVYVGAKDAMAAELVIAENPKVKAFAEQPGSIFPFDVVEWVRPEFHFDTFVVEIATT